MVEATYNPNMPFKWNAQRIQTLPNQVHNLVWYSRHLILGFSVLQCNVFLFVLFLESVSNATFTEDSDCCYSADCATDNVWCSGTAPTPVIIAGPDLSCLYYTTIADAATALITAATAERY